MILSLNELEALTRKAFRGTGYHWGEAEEAGKAVVWLARRGVPVAEPLRDLLNRVGDHPDDMRPRLLGGKWASNTGNSCPVLWGIALADGLMGADRGGVTEIPGLCAPLLILPFLASAACRTGLILALSCQGLSATASSSAVHLDHRSPGGSPPAGATLSAGAPHAPSGPALVARHHVANFLREDWEVLNHIAARTYVPASERSRLAGAGAGLTDSD